MKRIKNFLWQNINECFGLTVILIKHVKHMPIHAKFLNIFLLSRKVLKLINFMGKRQKLSLQAQ